MKLIFRRLSENAVDILPARRRRSWLDQLPADHPGRRLSTTTAANSFGWELISPTSFQVEWNGGPAPDDLKISVVAGSDDRSKVVASQLGEGILSFYTDIHFRPEPGFALMVTGPTNEPRDGMAPLTAMIGPDAPVEGLIVHWKMTRPGIATWNKGEPFGTIFSVALPLAARSSSNLSTVDAKPVPSTPIRRGPAQSTVVAEQNNRERLQQKNPCPPEPETPPGTKWGQTAIVNLPFGRQQLRVTNVLGPIGDGSPLPAESNPDYQRPTTSCLICTSPRSGSWLLSDGLISFANAGTPHEFFDYPQEKDWCKKLNINDESEYFSRFIAAGSTPNGVFTAKLLATQFANLIRHVRFAVPELDPESPEALQKVFGETKFIWLRRANLNAQAVSYYRATASKVWFDVGLTKPSTDAASIEFDLTKISARARDLEAFDAEWEAYFKRWNIEPMVVIYEELAHRYEEIVRSAIRFLGLPDADSKSLRETRYRRQADATTFDWLCRLRNETAFRPTSEFRRAEAERHYQAGLKHFEARDFESAQAEFLWSLDWEPMFAPAQHNAGSALANLGKPDAAIDHYKNALKLEPNSSETLMNMAHVYAGLGNLSEAEVFCRRAAESAPVPFDPADKLAHLAALARNG